MVATVTGESEHIRVCSAYGSWVARSLVLSAWLLGVDLSGICDEHVLVATVRRIYCAAMGFNKRVSVSTRYCSTNKNINKIRHTIDRSITFTGTIGFEIAKSVLGFPPHVKSRYFVISLCARTHPAPLATQLTTERRGRATVRSTKRATRRIERRRDRPSERVSRRPRASDGTTDQTTVRVS